MPPVPTRRPPRRASTPDDAERRRRDILDAALHVFAADGFAAATVDAIAATAGVAKGTVYLYYRSKDHMYRAALVEGATELLAVVADRIARATTVRETLHAFVGARLEYFERHRDFFRLYLAEFANRFSRALRQDEALDRIYLDQARALEQALATMPRGALPGAATPLDVALAVADLTRGIAVRRITGRSGRPLAADVEMVTQLAWKGLRPR